MLLSAEIEAFLDEYSYTPDKDIEFMRAVGIPLPLSLQTWPTPTPKAPSTPKPRSEAMKRFIARHGVKKPQKETEEHKRAEDGVAGRGNGTPACSDDNLCERVAMRGEAMKHFVARHGVKKSQKEPKENKSTPALAADGVPVPESDIPACSDENAQPDHAELSSTSGIVIISPASDTERDPAVAEMQVDNTLEDTASTLPDVTQASPLPDSQDLPPVAIASPVQQDEHSACDSSKTIGAAMEVDTAQNDGIHEASHSTPEKASPCDIPPPAESPELPPVSRVPEQNAKSCPCDYGDPSLTFDRPPSEITVLRAPTVHLAASPSPPPFSPSSPSSSASIARCPTPPWGYCPSPAVSVDADTSDDPSEAVLAACFVAAEVRIARVLAPVRRGRPPWGAATACGAEWLDVTGRRYRKITRRELSRSASPSPSPST